MQDLPLYNVAINRLTICLDQNNETLLRGGDSVSEDPRGENLRGNPNFHLQAGGATPLDTMQFSELKCLLFFFHDVIMNANNRTSKLHNF